MRLLGIDYGTKRVGIAVSDDEGRMAFPRETIANDAHLFEYIEKLCAEEEIGAVILGESRDFSDSENPMMEQVHQFRTTLEQRTGLPVEYELEALTTQQARRIPEKQEKTRKPHTRENVDASAAALILQSYIDKQQ